jgi:hypothetical protein
MHTGLSQRNKALMIVFLMITGIGFLAGPPRILFPTESVSQHSAEHFAVAALATGQSVQIETAIVAPDLRLTEEGSFLQRFHTRWRSVIGRGAKKAGEWTEVIRVLKADLAPAYNKICKHHEAYRAFVEIARVDPDNYLHYEKHALYLKDVPETEIPEARQKAVEIAVKAIVVRKKSLASAGLPPGDIWSSHRTLARCLAAADRMDDALEAYIEAARHLESLKELPQYKDLYQKDMETLKADLEAWRIGEKIP